MQRESDKDKAEIKPFTAEYTIIRKSDPIGTGIRRLEYLKSGKARYSLPFRNQLAYLL